MHVGDVCVYGWALNMNLYLYDLITVREMRKIVKLEDVYLYPSLLQQISKVHRNR